MAAVAGALAVLPVVLIARNARDPSHGTGHAEAATVGADPLSHARALWGDRCARCHSLAGTGGEKAPDLKNYDSRAWIRRFLQNPNDPLNMGPAKIERGMQPIQGSPEEMAALVELVYAETGAPDADLARAARGRELMPQMDCDTCHEIDGEGENAGPNLKGRGTEAWLEAVIADAGQGRLFGDRSRMPKFAGELTPAEIADLARLVLAQNAGPVSTAMGIR
ncbi:MAG TPA: c-type cytochrome [Polyangia bacterium]|nr:c-type cytochrome [Polyangia bacterium]